MSTIRCAAELEATVAGCHWEREEDSKYCIFHQPVSEKDNSQVATEFRRAVSGDRNHRLVELSTPPKEGSLGLNVWDMSEHQLSKTFVEPIFDVLELTDLKIEAEDNHQIQIYGGKVDELHLSNSTVNQPLNLTQVEIGYLRTNDTHFNHRVRIWYCGIDVLEARNAKFFDRFLCKVAYIKSVVSFERANFNENLKISFEETGRNPIWIDMRSTGIVVGELIVISQNSVVYDLADADIGDVKLSAPGVENPLDHYHIRGTEFNGFDFSHHSHMFQEVRYELDLSIIDQLSEQEEIYKSASSAIAPTRIQNRYSDTASRQITQPSLQEYRDTYLKAKNGANRVGAKALASEFFRKEMKFRRMIHRKGITEASGLREKLSAFESWGANLLLDAMTGHGERPRRVIIASIFIILLFSLVFAFLRETPPYGHKIGYLVLSIESFVTLVLNSESSFDNPIIRLVSQIEGFTGVFMIGLFVFTLTRSIDR